jgi:anti-sigma regulatory factor (Ser/Thr protein kinase)
MSDAVAIDLPLEPASARRAREQLEPFREALDEITFFDLRLLVSELIVEALNAESETHNARVELRAELRDGRVRVEVAESGGAFRLPSRRPEPGEAGWGLYLVGRLSSRWGLRRGPERSSVWLEVT